MPCRVVELGVGRGDRVAAYVPNVPEALIALLATASLGAIWSSCAPEFGVATTVSRFGQIAPKVLLAVESYRYGDTLLDRRAELAAIEAGLPGLERTVVIPHAEPASRGRHTWAELVRNPGPAKFEQVPFDHPLYILYSSGTTGLPKAIVHGHGGILLEHFKALSLHFDLGPGDRFFWFTTTGWMMWNFCVSGLLHRRRPSCSSTATRAGPTRSRCGGMVETERRRAFGVSAAFLSAARAECRVEPRTLVDLSALRVLGSTGSPAAADHGRVVLRAASRPTCCSLRLSGGTDVCTGFVGPSPLHPVWAGEISCRCLGAAVEVFDDDGRSVVDEEGELVLTAPLPSMPVGFWADPDGSGTARPTSTRFPGVWAHGDRTRSPAGAPASSPAARTGPSTGAASAWARRSSTRVVESLPGRRQPGRPPRGPGEGDAGAGTRAVPRPGPAVLDDALTGRVALVRAALSPRHVPDRMQAVAAYRVRCREEARGAGQAHPHGRAARHGGQRQGALANPEALNEYLEVARGKADVTLR